MGLPQCIEDPKYGRNALMFNFVFVFSAQQSDNQEHHASNYEPVVRKLAFLVRSLEKESEFLFRPESKKQLKTILPQIFNDLNNTGECIIPVDSANTIHLKLFSKFVDPPEVQAHQVPVRIRDLDELITEDWDLTLQQIVPYIDGVNYVKKIAVEADVSIELVKRCLQHLMFYECITMIDIFQYNNMYAVTENIRSVFQSEHLQRSCVSYVTRSGAVPLPFKDIMALYCEMRPGVRLSQLFTTHYNSINHRALITFGLVKGFLRRVHEYPIFINESSPNSPNNGGGAAADSVANALANLERIAGPNVTKLLDGKHSFDEICCMMAISHKTLEQSLAQLKDSCVIIYK
eukprot:GEZU01025110.1.p1 GENE.GEZU01025110.1~~GEZU01025110.1.p1  ORF type:complete len:347 (+),score=66.30 GEZU01025110.1:73-1113(+)